MVGMGFHIRGLTSVAVVFDTGRIHGPQHHSSCQDHGQRQERHDGRSICAKDSGSKYKNLGKERGLLELQD